MRDGECTFNLKRSMCMSYFGDSLRGLSEDNLELNEDKVTERVVGL